MPIFTHKCPHCLTEHIALRVVHLGSWGDWDAIVHLECPKCHMPCCALLDRGPHALTVDQLCSVAGDVLQMGWKLAEFWPQPPGPIIPELLPPDVERVYLQAERNFPIAGNEEAAGTMYRKALDVGLKKIDPTLSGMLGPRIKKLAAAGKLTKDIADWSDIIREDGNDAVHEEEPITRDELIQLRSFSEMVLRYLFSLPGLVRKRRGEKLDWEDANEEG